MATRNANTGARPGRVAGRLDAEGRDILTPWPTGTTQVEITVPAGFGTADEAVAVAVNPGGDDFTPWADGTEVVFPGESAVIDVSGVAPASLKVVLRSSGRATAYMARKR